MRASPRTSALRSPRRSHSADVRPHAAPASPHVRSIRAAATRSSIRPTGRRTSAESGTNIGAEDGLVAGGRGFRTIYGVIVQIADDPRRQGNRSRTRPAPSSSNVLKRQPHQRCRRRFTPTAPLAGAPAFTRRDHGDLTGHRPLRARRDRLPAVSARRSCSTSCSSRLAIISQRSKHRCSVSGIACGMQFRTARTRHAQGDSSGYRRPRVTQARARRPGLASSAEKTLAVLACADLRSARPS